MNKTDSRTTNSQNTDSRYGRNIEYWRMKANMKRSTVTRLMGWKPSTNWLWHVERNGRMPSRQSFEKLAGILGRDVSDLFLESLPEPFEQKPGWDGQFKTRELV
jgi:transcriptional regulator with XRE-family HTH domain